MMAPRRVRRLAIERARRGFSLVEIMIAMTVLTIMLLGLAGMTSFAGRRASTVAGSTSRTAVEVQVVDQLMVLPYNLLPAKAGCTTVATRPFPHTRCVTVTDVAPRRRRITVRFSPTNPRLRPDTVVFERSRGVSNSPIN